MTIRSHHPMGISSLEATQQSHVDERRKRIKRVLRKFMPQINRTALKTIDFNAQHDVAFQTFQKVVMTLLPGATSLNGFPEIDAHGKSFFKIVEIRDGANNTIWTRPEQSHGQLEELLLLWESRIYTWQEK